MLAMAHTVYTWHVCAQTCTHYSTYVYKCAWACLRIHAQHYSMHNVHTTCMHRHVAAHIHTQASCMFVRACARAKHVSWPRGMHAHVCILQHLCVHTCGHTPATCMCTCNSTRCVHLREEHVCLWVKLFLLHFSLMSPLLLPIAPKMQHL